jgi:hypothetical protein
MGHSRTPTQNTAGDGFPADPIDGTARVLTELPHHPGRRHRSPTSAAEHSPGWCPRSPPKPRQLPRPSAQSRGLAPLPRLIEPLLET